MADSPPSAIANPTLSDSPPPEYLNGFDLLRYSLIRATNLHDDEEHGPQTGATDAEESPGPSYLSASVNEGAAIRRGYLFHRDDNSSPAPCPDSGVEDEDQMTSTNVEGPPGLPSFLSRYRNEQETIPRGGNLEYGPSRPPRSVDGTEEEKISDGNMDTIDNQKQSLFTSWFNSNTPLRLTCGICRERQGFQEMAQLACYCVYCSACVRRRFTRAIESEYMFPAECCDLPMELVSVRQFLTPEILRDYAAKAVEYETLDRTYCANKSCLALINKKDIQGDKAVCTKSPCHTVTCAKCNGAWHDGDCPVDEDIRLLLAEADKQAWKRCAKCGVLIEYTGGCNHMTCQCGYQFCYCCTAIWKTCQCGQADLAQVLGVTDLRPNNDNFPQRVNRTGAPHRRARHDGTPGLLTEIRRVAMSHRQNELRLPDAENESTDNLASDTSPRSLGGIERLAQDYLPADGGLLFGEVHWGTDASPINEHSRPSRGVSPNTVLSVGGSTSRSQYAPRAANNATTPGIDRSSPRNTGLWSRERLDEETDYSSLEATGIQARDQMREFGASVQNLRINAVNNNETVSTLANDGLDPASHLCLENLQPFSHRPTPVVAPSTDNQVLSSTDNEHTPARPMLSSDARIMRRRRARERLERAWNMNGYMPNF